jgi:hypothetical protein
MCHTGATRGAYKIEGARGQALYQLNQADVARKGLRASLAADTVPRGARDSIRQAKEQSAGTNGGSGMVVVGPDRHFAARVAGVYSDKESGAPLIVTTALGATIDGRLRGMSSATYLNQQG